ncbi:MAG: hypothetical protein ACKVPX_15515 [Myxococcaceae bacterium]
MSQRTVWIVVSAAALMAMITVNGLANALPLNGLTTGAVSDGYAIRFVPAGYVFSIWGLIYLALIGFTVTQAFSPRIESLVAPLRPWFVLSCAANGAWIFAWHYLQLGLSVLLMLTLLGTLIVLYRRTRALSQGHGWAARWTLAAPVSLYLGWICVATVANISALLVSVGWKGAPLSEPTWAAVMMVAASAIVLMLSRRFHDAIPALVVVWALVGIIVKFPQERVMLWVGTLLVLALMAEAARALRPLMGSHPG